MDICLAVQTLYTGDISSFGTFPTKICFRIWISFDSVGLDWVYIRISWWLHLHALNHFAEQNIQIAQADNLVCNFDIHFRLIFTERMHYCLMLYISVILMDAPSTNLLRLWNQRWYDMTHQMHKKHVLGIVSEWSTKHQYNEREADRKKQLIAHIEIVFVTTHLSAFAWLLFSSLQHWNERSERERNKEKKLWGCNLY